MPSVAAALRLALLALGLAAGVASAAAGGVELTAVLALAGVAVALGLFLAARWGHAAGARATFALRIALAIALLGGALLLARAGLMAQALAVAWGVGGLGVVLGFLTPWSGLYAALALPLAMPLGGSPAWGALALAALALALADDDALGLDAWLARRGGLFPTVRVEVVLEPRR